MSDKAVTVESREPQKYYFDSTTWNDLKFLDEDIDISTYAKPGANGRWRDVLGAGEISGYERRAGAELGVECAHWPATGEHGPAPGAREAGEMKHA